MGKNVKKMLVIETFSVADVNGYDIEIRKGEEVEYYTFNGGQEVIIYKGEDYDVIFEEGIEMYLKEI